MHKLYLGTSGYNYKDWKDIFYVDVPQKDWLWYYSQHFNTVEVNATFYRDFPQTVFAKWREQTADDFVFVLKGPRMITHYKKLVDVDENIKLFFDHAAGLQKKLHVVLWQFPANFKQYDGNYKKVDTFLAKLPKNSKQVIEFRDTSWFHEDVYAMLNKYDVGFVINDADVFPSVDKVTDNVAYIRFHGPGKLYASSYSHEEMQKWAEKIRNFLERTDVYVYFNNDYFGYAIDNAMTLKNFLEEKR